MDNIKNDTYYAKRILRNIEVLSRYLKDKTQDDLLNDGFLCDAIENRFTKLSEDASKLSTSFKGSLPAVPWTGIYSIRNRICHDYDVVDAPTLYKTVKASFPRFRKDLLGALSCHSMTQTHDSFLMIADGRKTIVAVICDEEGRLLQVGDLIVFRDGDTKEEVVAEIGGLHVFSSLAELFASCPGWGSGYSKYEKTNPSDMLAHFRKEDIEKWGIVAIDIKRY